MDYFCMQKQDNFTYPKWFDVDISSNPVIAQCKNASFKFISGKYHTSAVVLHDDFVKNKTNGRVH